MRNDEGDEDGLGCASGRMWAVPLGILLWAVLIGSVVLVSGCHERASVESGRSQAVEVHVSQALSSAKASVSSIVRLD